MSDHLVDTPIRLAQCNRCEAYVYLAHASGVRAAADVAPAGRDAYIGALVAGRRTFDLVEAAGRPHKLRTRRLDAQPPSYDPNGAQTAAEGRRAVLVEHGCGSHAQNAVRFTEVAQGPLQAPATPGERRGGTRPEPVHASGLTVEEIPRSPAGRASRPRSDVITVAGTRPRIAERPPRCDICNAYIGSDELFWGIQHGNTWYMAEHEDCP